jgi:uncharacterized protein YecA (UPF0149 family)
VADFEELYIEIQGFYFYWAAYIQKQHKIDDDNKLISAKGRKCFMTDLDEAEKNRINQYGKEKAKVWVELHKRSHKKIGRNDYCPCGSGKNIKSVA